MDDLASLTLGGCNKCRDVNTPPLPVLMLALEFRIPNTFSWPQVHRLRNEQNVYEAQFPERVQLLQNMGFEWEHTAVPDEWELIIMGKCVILCSTSCCCFCLCFRCFECCHRCCRGGQVIDADAGYRASTGVSIGKNCCPYRIFRCRGHEPPAHPSHLVYTMRALKSLTDAHLK